MRQIPGKADRTFVTREEAEEFAAINGGVVRWNKLQQAGAPSAPEFKGLDRPPTSVRDNVRRRSGGRCEIGLPNCTRIATQQHHRQRRPVGPHTEANLVDSCANCHQQDTYSVHEHVEWAFAVGLLVSKNAQAPTEPWDRAALEAGPVHPVILRDLARDG